MGPSVLFTSITNNYPVCHAQLLTMPNILFTIHQGSSISGPRAKSGLRRLNNSPAEQHQNAQELFLHFLSNSFSSINNLYIYLLLMKRLILVKFSSVLQDAV